MENLENTRVVTRVVFTPEVIGERDGFTRRASFRGHLISVSYNDEGEALATSVGCSVSADTERICKLLLQAKLKQDVDSVLKIVHPRKFVVEPIKTFGLCARPD